MHKEEQDWIRKCGLFSLQEKVFDVVSRRVECADAYLARLDGPIEGLELALLVRHRT